MANIERLGIVGTAVAAVVTGCAAPRPPDVTFSPTPTPDKTLALGPQLPSPSNSPETSSLSFSQVIAAEIEKRRSPDQNEANLWSSAPQAGATFPPDNGQQSEQNLESRGQFSEDRLVSEFKSMEKSRVSLIKNTGGELDKDVPDRLDVEINVWDLGVTPPQLSYDTGFEPPFAVSLSGGFILNQSPREFSLRLLRLTSGFNYATTVEDPSNLSTDEALTFSSVSYADEVEAYLELAAKTGEFSIDYDPNFERVAATYILYGRGSEEFENVVKSVTSSPDIQPTDGISI